MIDIINQINTTHREIGKRAVATGEGRSLLLRRVYDAPIEDDEIQVLLGERPARARELSAPPRPLGAGPGTTGRPKRGTSTSRTSRRPRL